MLQPAFYMGAEACHLQETKLSVCYGFDIIALNTISGAASLEPLTQFLGSALGGFPWNMSLAYCERAGSRVLLISCPFVKKVYEEVSSN